MKRVEFKLSMPSRNSWNGRWSGEGRDYLIFKNLTDKKLAFLDLNYAKSVSWGHHWDDGWSARVTARVMIEGEKKKKSAGFSGYDWMVDNILSYNATEKKEIK